MSLFNPVLQTAGGQTRSQPAALASLAWAGAVHVAILVLLVMVVPAEQVAELIRPMAVRVIETAPPPSVSRPPPSPARPQTQVPQPALLSAPAIATAPAAFSVPSAPPATVPPAPTSSAPAAPITPPRFDAAYLNNPKPAYPAGSRRLGEEGKVILRVHVTPEGRSGEIELKVSSGHARLDTAAREAVAQWRFVPAQRGDEPVAAWVLVPIIFSLEG